MTTVEILRKAKAVLQRRGWHRGGWQASPDGPCCLGRALALSEESGWWNGPLEQLPGYGQIIAAAGCKPGQLTEWNDAPGRLVEEVFAVLDRAIALAGASETPKGGTP